MHLEKSKDGTTLAVLEAMRHLLALTMLLFAGCSATVGNPPDNVEEPSPITFKRPPEPKGGNATAPGCDGAVSKGECKGGKIVVCNVDQNRAQTIECKDGEQCVEDASRGAGCKAVTRQDPNATESSPCDGISEVGACVGNVAIYCDTSGEESIPRTYACADSNKTCVEPGKEGACADHTFCCETKETPADSCGDLTFDGFCDGDTVHWCHNGKPDTLDCTESGRRCQEDINQGSWCYGEVTPPSSGGELTPEAECAVVGFTGVCTDDKSAVKRCINGELKTETCTGQTTCQTYKCSVGAECCNPPDVPNGAATAQCEALGDENECTPDGDGYRYCDGNTDADIVEKDCPSGQVCMTAGSPGACSDIHTKCCNRECAELNNGYGICDDNVLRYCSQNTVIAEDCGEDPDFPMTCKPNGCDGKSEYAECCD